MKIEADQGGSFLRLGVGIVIANRVERLVSNVLATKAMDFKVHI